MSKDTVAPRDLIVIVEQEPLITSRIADVLAERGLESRHVASLAGVLRTARQGQLRAVVIDLSSGERKLEPAAAMGMDHMMRVLREMHPKLCLVALSRSTNVRIETLARELKIPIINKPVGSSELMTLLQDCGAVSRVEKPLFAAIADAAYSPSP